MTAKIGSEGASDHYAFHPDANRAAIVAERVRGGLADSLTAVLQSLARSDGAAPEALIARVRAGPVSPAVFGAYTELVETIFADDLVGAAVIADDLVRPGFGARDGMRIVTLTDSDLGLGQAARYRRLLDSDPEVGAGLQPLQGPAFVDAAARVREALALLDKGAPEIAGELRELVNEIALVGTTDEAYFGGASSFQLWGALFLRLEPDATRVDIAEALAHEAAHALLFGFGLGRPLVENPDDERYASPLRVDIRPMDGVLHATYVVARMHYTVTRLLASGRLTAAESAAAAEARDRHTRHYRDGARVIERHARWTPAGQAAFDSTESYMAVALETISSPPSTRL
ncbi:aKG-HExxH-type peptide beta-hydroxylase [Bauldia litoralis]|uniref:HEXXH motif-containing protein n=1 Tax=Bauldia litoralis TaxID=665467 RepID=A0A1G6EP86_9HYPH|nr:HEXXH motif-containing putative peptide modification protein [Bauldia litoralis]SDB59281.1 HEXXH motif-containing protein [Bauldia litoralis]